jgi:MFS family permease
MLTPRATIPPEHRANFRNLYLDIAWFGLLNGSAMSFITVYLVRIGADEGQVGLLGASPAIMAILLGLPAGWWLRDKPGDRAVFWTSVLYRFFYLGFVFLPVLFPQPVQIWLIIGITLAMSIPGTALAVGFNAMFADAVPPEWRGQVVGIRNALLAVTFIAASLLCGYLLETLPFPLNYQTVFALGVCGAAMSSYYLHRIRLNQPPPARAGRSIGDQAQPGLFRSLGDSLRVSVALRYLTRRLTLRPPQFSILRGPFGGVLLAFFIFHLTQHLAIPLFPIFWVDHLALTDGNISLGNALFYGMVFLGSTLLPRLTQKFGSHSIFFTGALLMSAYPTLTALTTNVGFFLLTSVVGGTAWSLAGGAISNYMLEKIPEAERPAHLAWYMVIANISVLAGSLGGPVLAKWLGLIPALFVIAGGRVISALGIWRLERKTTGTNPAAGTPPPGG